MRSIITSDLCYYDQEVLEELARRIADADPDLLVIAGNIGETLPVFTAALARFDRISCPKAVVTGSRDVWHRKDEHTSQQLWEEVLPAALRRQGFIWLEQENLVVEGVGICGTVGWYDYSSRDTTLGYTAEEYESLKGLVNEDAQYVDWQWTDREFASYIQRGFSSRIEALEGDHSVNHIMVVTHVPVFKEAIFRIPGDAQWNFGTAYAFNLTLGRVIAPKTKIRYVVSGSIRRAGEWDINFGNNTFKTIVIGRGVSGPLYVTVEL